MSNYKGGPLFFWRGCMRNVLPQTFFFKHIRLCKHFFFNMHVSANFFLTYTSPQTFFFQYHLRANNSFPFFNCHSRISFLQEILSYFQICYLLNTEWPLFNAQSVLIFILIPQFVTLFFIPVLVVIFFNILPEFSANIFFNPITFTNNLFSLFRPWKQFFNGFHTCPSEKLIVRMLV